MGQLINIINNPLYNTEDNKRTINEILVIQNYISEFIQIYTARGLNHYDHLKNTDTQKSIQKTISFHLNLIDKIKYNPNNHGLLENITPLMRELTNELKALSKFVNSYNLVTDSIQDHQTPDFSAITVIKDSTTNMASSDEKTSIVYRALRNIVNYFNTLHQNIVAFINNSLQTSRPNRQESNPILREFNPSQYPESDQFTHNPTKKANPSHHHPENILAKTQRTP